MNMIGRKEFGRTDAFKLGFSERLESEACGRTWDENQDLNEAYDRGRDFAEALFHL